MSKYNLARKLLYLEEYDSDDSERSVIYIYRVVRTNRRTVRRTALRIRSNWWRELREKSPPAPC